MMISSTESMESYLNGRGSISGGGWGFEATASFAKDSGATYESNQVIVIGYRDIRLGDDGLIPSNLPPFSDEAKDTLCANPATFHSNFGTHFIQAKQKGASIEMRTTITTESSSAAEKLTRELSADYSGVAVTTSSSASLDKEVKKSSVKST